MTQRLSASDSIDLGKLVCSILVKDSLLVQRDHSNYVIGEPSGEQHIAVCGDRRRVSVAVAIALINRVISASLRPRPPEVRKRTERRSPRLPIAAPK